MKGPDEMNAKLSRNAIIGYPAGIITGITYGLNPLFAKPLMNAGASTEAILLFRYGIAVILLGAYLLLKKENFRITLRQAGVWDCSIRQAAPSSSKHTNTSPPAWPPPSYSSSPQWWQS